LADLLPSTLREPIPIQVTVPSENDLDRFFSQLGSPEPDVPPL